LIISELLNALKVSDLTAEAGDLPPHVNEEKTLMAPTVSVIIPTYNRPQELMAAIGSVLNQTYQDFEIIIVDQSEGDRAQQIISDLGEERIRYVECRREGNFRGVSKARNQGIKMAHGRFLAFLDDDDLWLPNKLEKQVMLMENSSPNVGLIYCGCKRISVIDNELIKVDVPKHRGDVAQDIMRSGFILTITTLIRKECFENVGMFDETMEIAEDWDMWVKIGKAYHFDYIPDALAIYNVRPNAYNGPKPLLAWETVILKHIQDMSKKTAGSVYNRAAIAFYFVGDKVKAKKYSALALSNEIKWNYVAARLLFLFGPKFFSTVLRITKR
jgi:glycosyltransferase involved in cell wall biosynthesis